MDEFNRFQLKMSYDNWIKFKVAGATDLGDPEDWLKDIHDTKHIDNNIDDKLLLQKQ